MQGRMGRLTNYQTTLGLDQTHNVLPQLERRMHNAERLMNALEDVVRFQSDDGPEVRSNFMLVTALFPKMDEVSRRLLKFGVE